MDYITLSTIIVMLVFSLWKKLNEERREKRAKKQAQKRVQNRPKPIVNEGADDQRRYACQTATATPYKETKTKTPQEKNIYSSKVSEKRRQPGEKLLEQQERGIAFQTRSDARRAFIYSEIFQRKYE